ncbi:WLM domain-containing protein, partial [Dimargaris cristalligena]
ALLHRLQQDRGISAIMTKYRWQVHTLLELSPAERSILGYNRNRGEVIALRLRTDDLTGFRAYTSIREVLLHELAHMIHSNHGPDFHALNRQLNQDVGK